MAEFTRRRFLSVTAGTAILGPITGCVDSGINSSGDGSGEAVVQASFFVFGDFASQVAGETATAETLVPIGQHGHGWEPGPRVREDISDADVFVHGMTGFQPWADNILQDLREDDEDLLTVDVSAGIGLLEAGKGHDQNHGDGDHDGEDDHDDNSDEPDHGVGMDPHFWTDPVRAKKAVGNVRQGLVDVDAANADRYAKNTENYWTRLDDLDDRIASAVENASKNVILVAGHDAFQYFGDRYGVQIEALTNVSPDDQPTTRDIERAQQAIVEHNLEYICADPLEPQQAAEQLVEETDATEVLPLTTMPGLKQDWSDRNWGYVEIMENVNLPTLKRALDA